MTPGPALLFCSCSVSARPRASSETADDYAVLHELALLASRGRVLSDDPRSSPLRRVAAAASVAPTTAATVSAVLELQLHVLWGIRVQVRNSKT